MGEIHEVIKMTDNRFVNLYNVKATSVHQTPVNYFVASRAKDVASMKITTGKNHPDGVVIYSLYGEKRDRVVLIRQYRYTIGRYVYEFPAGLVEPGEEFHSAAVREMREETGLTFTPLTVDPSFERPFYTTVGLTDESCSTVFGFSEGEISNQGEEDSEEIEIVLADREEVRRILREEETALICAYMLMHFLEDEEDPFRFLR